MHLACSMRGVFAANINVDASLNHKIRGLNILKTIFLLLGLVDDV